MSSTRFSITVFKCLHGPTPSTTHPLLAPSTICINICLLFVPYAYQYITFLLSVFKITVNETLDYRAKRKVANFISQNWCSDRQRLLKNHNKLQNYTYGENNTSRVQLIIPTRIIFIVVVASFSFIRLRSTEVVEQRYLHDQRLQNHNST